MSKQQRKSETATVYAVRAPHEVFFERVEEITRKRFAAGDTGDQSSQLFLYRTDAEEPLRYDAPDDGEETRDIISSLLSWDRCFGVGYLTQLTFESFPDPRLAQRAPVEALPQPILVEAIVGVFHSPHELPRMIRIEIEGRGARRRIGKVRTDFTPTPSAVIAPATLASHEANDEQAQAGGAANAGFEQLEAPDIPQIIRGMGPTIVVLPPRVDIR